MSEPCGIHNGWAITFSKIRTTSLGKEIGIDKEQYIHISHYVIVESSYMGNNLRKAPPVQSVGSVAKAVHSRGVDKSQDQCRW